MIRRPPRSTLFPTRRSSDLEKVVPTVEWKDGVVRILDQSQLPDKVEFVACRDYETVGIAIKELWVRGARSEEHTSELQSPCNLVCRLLLEKKKAPESRNSRR